MTAFEKLMWAIQDLVEAGVMLDGKLSLAPSANGLLLRAWVSGTQLLGGKRVKNAPLLNKQGERLTAEVKIIGYRIGDATEAACGILAARVFDEYAQEIDSYG